MQHKRRAVSRPEKPDPRLIETLKYQGPSEYPDGLSDIICALDVDVTPAEAASLIASELFSAINEGSTKKLLGEYRSLCIVPGRRIFFEKNGEREYARALCVNPDFSLSVRLESDGSEKALTGGGIFFA